jgi:hypothetical protein
MENTTLQTSVEFVEHGFDYADFLNKFNDNFHNNVGNGIIFDTDVDTATLFETYLNIFHEGAQRQHYNCIACRKFVLQFGGLAYVDKETTKVKSALWNYKDKGILPQQFVAGFESMAKAVEKAPIKNVFFHDSIEIGYPEKGGWKHMAAIMPITQQLCHKENIGKMRGKYTQEFELMLRTISAYSVENARQANYLFSLGTVPNSEKVKGVAQWFYSLLELYHSTKNHRERMSIVWSAVATAPIGFAHLKNNLLGTVLNSLKYGNTVESIIRSYTEKADPTKYRRPTADATDNQLEVAAQYFKKIGAESALQRRIMLASEVEYFWQPKAAEASKEEEGPFDKLKTSKKKEETIEVTTVTPISWVKFQRDVLPHATKIEIRLRPFQYALFVLTTCVDPNAYPIHKWDSFERRNQTGHYTSAKGRYPSELNIPTSVFVPVLGFTNDPITQVGMEHHNTPKQVYCLIDGAKETGTVNSCIFPETLKSEFNEFRQAIEQYSNNTPIGVIEGQQAIGLSYVCSEPNRNAGTEVLKVLRSDLGGYAYYNIDRWE